MRNRSVLIVFCALLFSFFYYNSLGQDIDRVIAGEKPLTVSGGINATQIFYGASGIENRRDPYSYFLSGNVNFDLYGFSVPLAFTFSNQDFAFQQPFNQFSLSPTYKNVTAHIGYSTLNYSRYSLAGHIFFGGGLEVREMGNFYASAMYGRLLKAVELDSINGSVNDPAYRRIGYGIKGGWRKGADFAEIILFRSRDDESSIGPLPLELAIFPEENLVLSFNGAKAIGQKLLLLLEVATSGLTRDFRAPLSEDPNRNVFNYVGPLFNPNSTSSFYNAYNTGLNYTGNGYTIGVGYERVEPGYKTHGGYFFNNDLENFTVNSTFNMLKQKVNFAVNVGLQRNNLDKSQLSTLRRLVGSINMGISPTPKTNINLSYSNFQSFTNIRSNFEDINSLTPFDNLDTLNYTQIAQNATINGNFILGNSDKVRQNLNFNLTFQTTTDEQGGDRLNNGTDFYNINTAYSYSMLPIKLTLTGAFNANINNSPDLNTMTLGPTLAITKSFFERKFRATLSSSYNNTFLEDEKTNTVFNLRIGLSYKLKEKHNFNFNNVLLNRNGQSAVANLQQFTEYTGTLTYSFNF